MNQNLSDIFNFKALKAEWTALKFIDSTVDELYFNFTNETLKTAFSPFGRIQALIVYTRCLSIRLRKRYFNYVKNHFEAITCMPCWNTHTD